MGRAVEGWEEGGQRRQEERGQVRNVTAWVAGSWQEAERDCASSSLAVLAKV